MSDHQELQDNIPAYALGALDESESRLLESHLSSCQQCQEILAAYEETTSRLGHTIAQNDPPAHLKEELMKRIGQTAGSTEIRVDRKSFFENFREVLRFPKLAWAPLATAAMLLLLVVNVVLWRQAAAPAGHSVQTITLAGTTFAPDADGVMAVAQGESQGILVISDLAPLPSEQQYQLWLIDENGGRDSGAIFSVDQVGRAEVTVVGDQPLLNYADFGITVEPFGGSPGPTGQKVLGLEL